MGINSKFLIAFFLLLNLQFHLSYLCRNVKKFQKPPKNSSSVYVIVPSFEQTVFFSALFFLGKQSCLNETAIGKQQILYMFCTYSTCIICTLTFTMTPGPGTTDGILNT
jgi:hypothetical protein